MKIKIYVTNILVLELLFDKSGYKFEWENWFLNNHFKEIAHFILSWFPDFIIHVNISDIFFMFLTVSLQSLKIASAFHSMIYSLPFTYIQTYFFKEMVQCLPAIKKEDRPHKNEDKTEILVGVRGVASV